MFLLCKNVFSIYILFLSTNFKNDNEISLISASVQMIFLQLLRILNNALNTTTRLLFNVSAHIKYSIIELNSSKYII